MLLARDDALLAEVQLEWWESDGSENHHLVARIGQFLATQWLKDIPEYRNRTFVDGSTLEEQYDTRLAYLSAYIDGIVRKGLFREDGAGYEKWTVGVLHNLYDFA